MANVIVAFSKPGDAKNIKNILMKSGFFVTAVCTSGAQALVHAGDLESGILVCGYRLADMMFEELYDCMPPEFSMLLISSPGKWTAQMREKLVCLPMPLKVHDLIDALGVMAEAQERERRLKRRQPKRRSDEEKRLIERAKGILMERSGMTEEEAHRYIQKCSMDSGTDLTETAQMIIELKDS